MHVHYMYVFMYECMYIYVLCMYACRFEILVKLIMSTSYDSFPTVNGCRLQIVRSMSLSMQVVTAHQLCNKIRICKKGGHVVIFVTCNSYSYES